MAIYLTNEEMGALSGLPHSVITLYIMAIRPRMDYSTGLVGILPRVSWQALAEWVYVEPGPGTRHARPDKHALRRMVARLERAGLIEIRTRAAARQLVFKCRLAQTDKHVQKQPAPRPHHPPAPQAAPSKTKHGAGFQPEPAPHPAPQETVEPAPHPRSEKSTCQPSSSTSTAVDADQAGDDDGLIYSEKLTTTQRLGIWAKLIGLDKRRMQAVLDELAGFMAQREIKNPVRYVDYIIAKAKAPGWLPELAGLIAEGRARQAADAALRLRIAANASTEAAKGTPPPPELAKYARRKAATA